MPTASSKKKDDTEGHDDDDDPADGDDEDDNDEDGAPQDDGADNGAMTAKESLLFAAVYMTFMLMAFLVLNLWLTYGSDECPQPPPNTL